MHKVDVVDTWRLTTASRANVPMFSENFVVKPPVLGIEVLP